MLKRIKLLISGDVQGVFFRKFIYEHALKLDLKGYVKNTLDEKVEAVFEGKKENINKMISLCQIGPPSARVTNIEVKKEKPKKEVQFKLLR